MTTPTPTPPAQAGGGVHALSKQHRDSWFEPRKCSTNNFDIEINLYGKINTGYHLPVVVKVIPDFDGHDPTKILLYIFCGIYS